MPATPRTRSCSENAVNRWSTRKRAVVRWKTNDWRGTVVSTYGEILADDFPLPLGDIAMCADGFPVFVNTYSIGRWFSKGICGFALRDMAMLRYKPIILIHFSCDIMGCNWDTWWMGNGNWENPARGLRGLVNQGQCRHLPSLDQTWRPCHGPWLVNDYACAILNTSVILRVYVDWGEAKWLLLGIQILGRTNFGGVLYSG